MGEVSVLCTHTHVRVHYICKIQIHPVYISRRGGRPVNDVYFGDGNEFIHRRGGSMCPPDNIQEKHIL